MREFCYVGNQLFSCQTLSWYIYTEHSAYYISKKQREDIKSIVVCWLYSWFFVKIWHTEIYIYNKFVNLLFYLKQKHMKHLINEKYFVISDIIENLWMSFQDLHIEFARHNIDIQADQQVSYTTLSHILSWHPKWNYETIRSLYTQYTTPISHTYILWSENNIQENEFHIHRWAKHIWISEETLKQELYTHGHIQTVDSEKTISLDTIRNIIKGYKFDYNTDKVLSWVDVSTYKHYTWDEKTTYDIDALASIIWVPTSSLVWRLVYHRAWTNPSEENTHKKDIYTKATQDTKKTYTTLVSSGIGAAAIYKSVKDKTKNKSLKRNTCKTKGKSCTHTTGSKTAAWASTMTASTDYTKHHASKADLTQIYDTQADNTAVAYTTWKEKVAWWLRPDMHKWIARWLLWFLSLWLLGGIWSYRNSVDTASETAVHSVSKSEVKTDTRMWKTKTIWEERNPHTDTKKDMWTIDSTAKGNTKPQAKNILEEKTINTVSQKPMKTSAPIKTVEQEIIDKTPTTKEVIQKRNIDLKKEVPSAPVQEHKAAITNPKTLPSTWGF